MSEKVIYQLKTVEVKDHERTVLSLTELGYSVRTSCLVQKPCEPVYSSFFLKVFHPLVVLDGILDTPY